MIRTDVQLGWKSIPGHRHVIEGRENEDAVLISQEHPCFDALIIVADGMGGHPEPQQAAQTAVAAVRDYLSQPAHLEELAERRTDAVALLSWAVEHANSRVRRLAVRVPSGREDGKAPGCTLTLAAIADGQIAVALVGDGSVFLYRDRQLRSLAGGEARRLGNRPEEFLGRADRVEVETAREAARAGDRLLLCTDGLTRYFGAGQPFSGSGGLERLQQVVARPTADPRALASQLTADGRGEQYDDDTTVVIAEVGAAREVPDPRPRREVAGRADGAAGSDPVMEVAEGRRAGLRAGYPASLGMGVSLLLGVALAAAAGFYAGRAWRHPAAPPAALFQPFSDPAVGRPNLPPGGILLVNRDTGRFFTIRTRPAAAPVSDGPVLLSELRYVPGKGLKDTGRTYRFDPARGLIKAPDGRVYPVSLDAAAGVIEIQQAGTLRVTTQPAGLPVLIDGRSAGATPGSWSVRAGWHQVQVQGGHGRGVIYDERVVVTPRSTLALSLTVPGPAASRVPRP